MLPSVCIIHRPRGSRTSGGSERAKGARTRANGGQLTCHAWVSSTLCRVAPTNLSGKALESAARLGAQGSSGGGGIGSVAAGKAIDVCDKVLVFAGKRADLVQQRLAVSLAKRRAASGHEEGEPHVFTRSHQNRDSNQTPSTRGKWRGPR